MCASAPKPAVAPCGLILVIYENCLVTVLLWWLSLPAAAKTPAAAGVPWPFALRARRNHYPRQPALSRPHALAGLSVAVCPIMHGCPDNKPLSTVAPTTAAPWQVLAPKIHCIKRWQVLPLRNCKCCQDILLQVLPLRKYKCCQDILLQVIPLRKYTPGEEPHGGFLLQGPQGCCQTRCTVDTPQPPATPIH